MTTNSTEIKPSVTVASICPALLTRRKERSVPLPELKEAVINFDAESRVGIPVDGPSGDRSSVDARIVADDLHPLKYWQYEIQSLEDGRENMSGM